VSQVKIFVSYSHRDRAYLNDDHLIGFLKGLERDDSVRFWMDESLMAGDRWDEKIKKELETSHIALLLISQAFLDSFYCMNIEVKNFLHRRQASRWK
jgi:internalin A